MGEDVEANRSTGICIGAIHPNADPEDQEANDEVDFSHPYGYFCHYAMAWNKPGTLAKHWVSYYDKIETRDSKMLEECEEPRKVAEKHPVKRIETEE